MKNMKKYTSLDSFKADYEKEYPFVALVADNGQDIKNRVYTQYYNSFDDMSGKMKDGVLQENDVFVPYDYAIWSNTPSYVLVSSWMKGQTLSQLYDFLTNTDHQIKIEKLDYFVMGRFDFDSMGRKCSVYTERNTLRIEDDGSDGQSTGFWIEIDENGNLLGCSALDEDWSVFEDYVIAVKYVKNEK